MELDHYESVRSGEVVYLPDKALVPRAEDDVICRMIAIDQVIMTHPADTPYQYTLLMIDTPCQYTL